MLKKYSSTDMWLYQYFYITYNTYTLAGLMVFNRQITTQYNTEIEQNLACICKNFMLLNIFQVLCI